MVTPNNYIENPEAKNASQDVLSTIIDLAKSTIKNDLANSIINTGDKTNDDGFGYLRTLDTSICVVSYDRYSQETRQRLGLGDIEIDITHWLDPTQLGKGLNEFFNFKFYVGNDGIRGIRIFNIRKSVNSPLFGGDKNDGLPVYLEDNNEAISSMKQSFEGLPEQIQGTNNSVEQLIEIGRRVIGGLDPNALEMGLLNVNQHQAEELIDLLVSAEPTTNPYFEEI